MDIYIYTHIYITESFCCTLETYTTLLINYTSILQKGKKKRENKVTQQGNSMSGELGFTISNIPGQ